jgi:hypothetical protein
MAIMCDLALYCPDDKVRAAMAVKIYEFIRDPEDAAIDTAKHNVQIHYIRPPEPIRDDLTTRGENDKG